MAADRGRTDGLHSQHGGGSRITTGGAVVNEVEYDVFSSETFNPTVGLVYHATPQTPSAPRRTAAFERRPRPELYRDSTARGGVVVARPTPTSIPNI